MHFRKKILRFSVFLFCLFLSFRAYNQLNPNNLVHYSEMDGTIIYDILNDRQGNIWMATQNGLVCYNGYEFRRFFPDSNDSTSIGNILTYCLLEDSRGRIWIGGMDGADVYDPGKRTFRHLSIHGMTGIPDDGQPLVNAIGQGPDGTVYLGTNSGYGYTTNHSILYSNPGEYRLNNFEVPGTDTIQNVIRLTTDRSGNLWFFCNNGLFEIDRDRNVQHLTYPTDLPTDQLSMKDIPEEEWAGMIWATDNTHAMFCYSPARKSFLLFTVSKQEAGALPVNTVYTILQDSLNNLWIGTDQGLILYNRQQDRFEAFPPNREKAFMHDQIPSLHIDESGNLWIGTHSNGLLKFNERTTFQSIVGSTNESSVLRSGWIGNLVEASDGNIWFRSAGEGEHSWQLFEMDPNTQSIIRYDYWKLGHGVHDIVGFIELAPGEFLVSTNQGNFHYYPAGGRMDKCSITGFPEGNIYNQFFRDSSGNIWIMAFDGLYLTDGRRVIRKYDLSQAPGGTSTSNSVGIMFEGSKNTFWLLTNDGLFFLDRQKDTIERVGFDKTKGDVFLSQDINSFYLGPDSIAWVGTWLGGLSRYDMRTGKIKTYKTGDGLPSMSIQGILADEKNHVLWLSTFNGLSRFDIAKESFDNFSVEDGIHGQLFSECSYLETSKGLFIFGGSNGLTFFDPDKINIDSRPPKIYITDFKVANSQVANDSSDGSREGTYNDGNFRLKFFQDNISIDYVGIHYANPAKNRFAYMLENYDEGWREVGNQRTAYYYNLPAGEYTFRVKAANSNGVWNETGASMHFVITPPWWRSWWAYGIYAIMLLAVIFMLDRIQRRRVVNRERALAKEKELAQAREIEKAYHELKTTQSQLVHAEKMASLGELTAGIAHEIQNPLNFVNNFSEVSLEMLGELKDEMASGSMEEAESISEEIRRNLEKINIHGKRASGIVKGMLDHSRTNTGQKEPTDINALADEYLRLAYHGLRARNKSFNADFHADLDESLPMINVVPQEIGRVFLNLINNAFYAVDKKRQHGYRPTVTVTTKNLADRVEIRVKDNGNGIPADIREKIFQPFFTTKPAGEGTGLGLSLSYDIITKGHQGEISVETKAGEGTEFIILLPN